jgi:hypothetical protein
MKSDDLFSHTASFSTRGMRSITLLSYGT